MGRHRPDPRGHARILIAAFAVVLALALLIVGGIALFRAMAAKPGNPAGLGRTELVASTLSRPVAQPALIPAGMSGGRPGGAS